MKALFKSILAVILFASPFYLQAQFTDDFSDGDFTNNPQWSGNDTSWVVNAGQLQSFGTNLSGSYSRYLSTPSLLAADAQWEFFANPKVATTNGNYMDIYLTSDSANLLGSNSGYFVRIGNSTDEVSLYLKQGGVSTKIIDGTDGLVAGSSNNPMKIKVIASSAHQWDLFVDIGGKGNNYISEGSIVDSTLTGSAFFGVLVKYSASNYNKYFFDDFYVGPIIFDNTPPVINTVNVITTKKIDVVFSEDVEISTAQTLTNYSADNGLNNPNAAVRDLVSFNVVHLTFTNAMTLNVNNTLTVSNVFDTHGNVIAPASTSTFMYAGVIISAKDVIINEIFADPTPAVGLPNAEYVELYNRSNSVINLNGMKFCSSSTVGTLGSYLLNPGSYLILCKSADTTLLQPYGNVLGMGTWPVLVNAGTTLYVREKDNSIVDSVQYALPLYHDAVKEVGGWSLELINPNFVSLCSADANWNASIDTSGGTPGVQNSILSTSADVTGPQVMNMNVVDSSKVSFCFNEYVDPAILGNRLNYTMDNGLGNPDSVSVSGWCVDMHFNAGIPKDVKYTMSFSNVVDCSGNVASALGTDFGYYTPVASFGNSSNNFDALFTDNSTIAMGTITSWQWLFGDGDSSTVQNPLHTYLTTGNFDVCLLVTASNGLQDSSCINLQIFNVGQKEMHSRNLNVFPNPSKGEVFISNEGIEWVSIYNLLGEEVYQEKISSSASTIKMDLSALAPGTYLMKTKSAKALNSMQIQIVR